jgi:type IV pilus assembly protein PilB
MWHIGELLIQKKLISWEQLEVALDEQKKTKELVGEILVRKGFVPPVLFYRTLAEQNRMRYVDLARTRINMKAVQKVPRSIAKKFRIMPIEIVEDTLTVAIPNPLAMWPQQDIKQLANVTHLQAVLCLPQDIDQAIKEYYGTENLSGLAGALPEGNP